MKRPTRRRRTRESSSVLLVLLLAVRGACGAVDGWKKHWQRFDVQAHLDNSGKVEISECVSIKLTNEVDALGRTLANGNLDELELPLPSGPDQTIVLHRLVREDETGEHILTKGDVRQQDRYFWGQGVLTWGVRAPGDAWKGETVHFRVEYELQNALDPSWEIPIRRAWFGARSDFWNYPQRFHEALAAWKDAGNAVSQRYRYEHEVRFATSPATGPIFLRAIPAVRGSKLLILVTIVWAALAVLLFGVLHFGTNLPFSAFASGGLGLYWTAALLFLFLSMRTVKNTAHARRKRETARATIYARLQLLLPSPALGDEWIPQLRALGLGDAIKQWNERSRKGRPPEFEATGLPPFTGVPLALQHENEWTEAIYIPAKEVPSDTGKEDDEDSES